MHVPHHVNSKIPWYNLRKANDSLKANWGEYMTSCTFNWRMMKTIFTGERPLHTVLQQHDGCAPGGLERHSRVRAFRLGRAGRGELCRGLGVLVGGRSRCAGVRLYASNAW